MSSPTRPVCEHVNKSWIVGLGLCLWVSLQPLLAQEAGHPLDPLTYQEYWTVLEVLRDEGHVNDDTLFPMVSLRAPEKKVVWAWSKGGDFPREASALVRQGREAHEAVVDLVKHKLISWKALKDGHATWLFEEGVEAGKETKKHPDLIAAMKRRGIDDLAFIDCFGIPPGYFATEEQRGKRILNVYCTDARRVHDLWRNDISGLTVVYDANEKQVVRVVDEGVVPIAGTLREYLAPSAVRARDVPGPMRVEQPLGPGFRIQGHVVEWQNWRFHYRPDQRTGMVISTVTYRDGDRDRPVLYEGHLSEIFVPYMDPSFGWYQRNFLDAGEFSAGGLAQPLMPGRDCPEQAVYSDGWLNGVNGRPKLVKNVICLLERESGDMAWRHSSSEPESRRKRDLVVRFAAVLGNYDYVFDWIFQQDGSIRVTVGSTGIAETKTVAQSDSASAGAADAYGRFVDKHIVAVNHDHYFNFRIDLDIDGPLNNFMAERLVAKTLPKDHPRRSIWVGEHVMAQKESEGKLNIDMKRPSMWRVTSTTRTNHVRYPTSFELMPSRNSATLLSEDDYPRRRAGFIDHHLWVTPYRPEERYAAGDYPTLSEPGRGLPEWTKQDRPIKDTDIVLWYTIGMHHMVRNEDWPVMPVMWNDFELRPFDFFDRNPSLDLPDR